MITNTKTIAVSVIAIAAVIALFAATPFVVAHQAQAFGGRWGGGGWGHRGGFGFGFHRGFGGGFGGLRRLRRLRRAGVAVAAVAVADVAAVAAGAAAGKTVPSTFLFFKTRKRKFTQFCFE